MPLSFPNTPHPIHGQKSVGITFETYPEYDYFSPPQVLLWTGGRSCQTWIIARASPLTTQSTDHSHHSQCEPLNTEVRSHNSSPQSPAGAPSHSRATVLQTAQQSTARSACSHRRHRPEPVSSHSPSRSLLSATLAALPVLEHARCGFCFARSRISFYLIPFLPSSFCQEVTSSSRLP